MGCHLFKRTTGRFLSLVFAIALLSVAIPARAASVSLFLNQSNSLPDDINYLSVMLTENGVGGVDFLVKTLSPLNDIAGRNFGIQKFGFNFLDEAWGEISNLPEGWKVRSNRRMDGFGKFDIRLQGKGRHRSDELSFTVNGVTLGDFASLMSARVAGFEWCTDERRYNWCGDRFCTTSAYFAGHLSQSPPPDPNAVPVPAALWLFGSGVIGLAAVAKRRKQKASTSMTGNKIESDGVLTIEELP